VEELLLKFKIEIDRAKCIACGTCYSLDPLHFEPGEDRKSNVVGGIENEKSEGHFDDENIEEAQEAAESCPVSIIKVTTQP
jgi:ferredoxin